MNQVGPTAQPFIICITGTKGKTTVARLLNYSFTSQHRPTLLVDSDGHYINNIRYGTKLDSRQQTNFDPTVRPGRFLVDLPATTNSVAILETSIGSYRHGLGYANHQIGVFTNVFEDHINRHITSRAELAQAKAQFVFGQLAPTGTAIFNADDPFVVGELPQLAHRSTQQLIPVGTDFKYFDLAAHHRAGGIAVAIQPPDIQLLTPWSDFTMLNTSNFDWTFHGTFLPSLYNLAFAAAALYAEQPEVSTSLAEIRALTHYQPTETGGRLVIRHDDQRQLTIIIDYAHEPHSLQALAKAAQKLSTGKTIGVIRFVPNKSDQYLRETSRTIAHIFDTIIIYDKVDGIHCFEHHSSRTGQIRRPGEVARLVYQTICKYQDPLQQIHLAIPEGEAIAQAFAVAKPGDVIVHISNDHHRSYELVTQHLTAPVSVGNVDNTQFHGQPL